jgi:hypothetical protein
MMLQHNSYAPQGPWPADPKDTGGGSDPDDQKEVGRDETPEGKKDPGK